jgi:hypothetical protein
MFRYAFSLHAALASSPPCADADPLHSAPPNDARTEKPAGDSEGSGTPGARTFEWATADRVREPSPRASLEWALWQLVPSPALGVGDSGAVFGLRWQVTPVLYSFATDPRLSRWRWFVAEPIVRQSGSVELYFSPEYLTIGNTFGDRLGARMGIRSYFGLIQRGDYLSVSVGTSYYRFGESDGVSYEGGVYALFGILGLQLTHSPGLAEARWLGTLRLRYF